MAASADSDGFFKASDFAGDFLKKNGKSRAGALLVTGWPGVVGPAIAKVSRVSWVSANEIRISVKDPLWLTELEYRKGDILRKIHLLFPDSGIERLRFFLDKKNDWRNEDEVLPEIKLDLNEIPPLAPEVLEESFRGSPVSDPDLKKSLARLCETSLRVEAFRKKHPDFDKPKPIPVRPTDDTVDWYLPETGISSQFLSLDPDES